jgi:hypothetical protein
VTRRPVLPGASELFRRTDAGASVPEVTELPSLSTTTSSPALRGGSAGRRSEESGEQPPLTLVPGGATDELSSFRAVPQPVMQPTIPTRGRPTRRTERNKHDEKITVYISADELLALETARVTLRGQHGVAADRGRIVREAISVILADLGERGDDSVLVRRLRGEG